MPRDESVNRNSIVWVIFNEKVGVSPSEAGGDSDVSCSYFQQKEHVEKDDDFALKVYAECLC